MTSLSNGTTTINPVAVLGYESTSEHGNIVHRILGSEQVDVLLRPASLRSGSMTLLMGIDEAGSAAAETALRTATIWTLTPGNDPSTVGMRFVVTGDVTRTLDDATVTVWTVGFGWQEIGPA